MTRSQRLKLLLCLLPAVHLYAQFETSELLGTVRDNTGGAVAKANVTILQQDTGIESKTTTDENGNYDFFNVKIGRYTVSVEATGFTKFTTTDVMVNVNVRGAGVGRPSGAQRSRAFQ